jgi:hypothetical protein
MLQSTGKPPAARVCFFLLPLPPIRHLQLSPIVPLRQLSWLSQLGTGCLYRKVGVLPLYCWMYHRLRVLLL